MPRYLFRYTEVSLDPSDPFPDGLRVRRPLLVVSLIAPDGSSLDCVACPDTGADHCVFPLSFALALGLNPLDMRSNVTTGVGNPGNETYFENVRVRLDRGLEFEAFVGFTAGLDAVGYGLLGQVGFFDKYVVLFDNGESEFCIYTK